MAQTVLNVHSWNGVFATPCTEYILGNQSNEELDCQREPSHRLSPHVRVSHHNDQSQALDSTFVVVM